MGTARGGLLDLGRNGDNVSLTFGRRSRTGCRLEAVPIRSRLVHPFPQQVRHAVQVNDTIKLISRSCSSGVESMGVASHRLVLGLVIRCSRRTCGALDGRSRRVARRNGSNSRHIFSRMSVDEETVIDTYS